jgi:guanine deaminase
MTASEAGSGRAAGTGRAAGSSRATIVRGHAMHVPRDPFAAGADALESFPDGALAFAGGRILAAGDHAAVARLHPGAEVVDARGAILLPGLVDTHVHFPQLGILGAMGLELLDWLERRALPEEARLADDTYARALARDFIGALAANGTTTALVFGSHFRAAQDALFEEAERRGLRIASGLVVSDRHLRPELHRTPQEAYDAGRELAARWHGRGRLRYAVTPRFSLSCSEAMLESSGALAAELGDALVTTHVNESPEEVRRVGELFPSARDYLDTYERAGLVGPSTVLAHDVHVTDGELARLAATKAAVANCPSSNAFLGSGIFPMRRHLDAGVRFALGTDVGAGTSPSVLGECLASHQAQMPQGLRLRPAHLLWLATAAGAEALGLGDEVGDLTTGKQADFVLVRPPRGSTLAKVVARSQSAEDALGAVVALAREESVVEVRVAGERVAPAEVTSAP